MTLRIRPGKYKISIHRAIFWYDDACSCSWLGGTLGKLVQIRFICQPVTQLLTSAWSNVASVDCDWCLMSGLLVLLQDYFGLNVPKVEKLSLKWKSTLPTPANVLEKYQCDMCSLKKIGLVWKNEREVCTIIWHYL